MSLNENKFLLGPQHFELLTLIGEGAFGKVLLVKNKLNERIYAMKTISKKLLKKKNHILYMKSEREILTKVDHPFVVPLRFAFQTEKRLFLVMDYLAGGELFYHLRKMGVILENDAKFYIAEIILAIEYLHNIGIVHRDLKPENVLLASDGHVMITDFGLAKETGNQNNNRTLCGTSEYMAPEMLTRNGYGKAVDWWAIGILLYEMLSGNPPFQADNQKDLDKKIMSEKPKLPTHASPTAHSILKGLLEKDMNKRLGSVKGNMFTIGGVSALKKHEFFEHMDWNALLKKKIDPPIDVTSPSNEDDPSPLNFNKEFTEQEVSYSMIEDTLSNCTTPARSRAGSEDFYDNFDYIEPSFECSSEKLLEFENELAARLVKLQKKKAHKDKMDEIKAIKQAEIDAAEKIRLEEARKLKEQEELEKARLLEAEREKRRLAEQKRIYILEQRERYFYWDKIQKELEEFNSACDKISKKLKNLRKKLRDINDLEQKQINNIVLNNEQKDKISKKNEVLQEIEEAESAEKELLDNPPVVDESIPKPDTEFSPSEPIPQMSEEFSQQLSMIEDKNISQNTNVKKSTKSKKKK